ncbi:MAG: single-stranded-DNA-specific exonuclease RecJ [Candidatus Kapaibacteriales bacterium]
MKSQPEDEKTRQLSKTLKIPKAIANVLSVRGLDDKSKAESFFRPSLDRLHDPFLMKNMDKASERILQAKNEGEKIWIHGDYDVDGVTSTSLALVFLREMGIQTEYYIPDRFQDGFGLSKNSVNRANSFGASLILTVDVGITAHEELAYATELGIDAIICDHHQTSGQLPDIYAILDPIQEGCEYPFKSLSACGVVFKLIQAVLKKLGREKDANKYLDFVALSSIADMVPLVDENRIMVYHGLKLINKNTRPGLQGLIYCTRLKPGSITSANIGYNIAPMIHAAGRMGDPMRAVDMFIQDNDLSAFNIAQKLEDENRKRRVYDHETLDEAIPYAEELIKQGRKSLVIHNPNWHPGIIGIVASRLVERFSLPTVLMTSIAGYAKGSSRSTKNFNVFEALQKAHHLMIEYGGHKHAAGLTMEERNVDELRDIFDAEANKHITNEMMSPEIEIDTALNFNELSPVFFKSLNKIAPFGYDNPKPVFFSKGVRAVSGVKVIGQNNIKFRAKQNNFVIDAIGFNMADKVKYCQNGKRFSVIYHLEMNNYNGSSLPQIFIRDIKPEGQENISFLDPNSLREQSRELNGSIA